MRIMVDEIPIHDALARARSRFEELDRRMTEACGVGNPARAAVAGGALAIGLGVLAALGASGLPPQAALPLGVLALVTGGALLGYGIPLWRRHRGELAGLSRRWKHALETLRLRESQAEEDPRQSVEVLRRMDGRDPVLSSLRYGSRLWTSSVGVGKYRR